MAEFYHSAFDRTCKELERQIKLKESREAKLELLLQTREAEARNREEQRKLACKQNGLALRSQMSFNLQRRMELRKMQHLPGIDPGFSGFPNIPETPSAIRLQNKRVRQQDLKTRLDEQALANHQRHLQAKQLSLNSELATNTHIQQELQRHKQLLSDKQMKQKADLIRAYQEAERLKSLQRSLDVSVSMMRTFDSQPEQMIESPQDEELLPLEEPDSPSATMLIDESTPLDLPILVESPQFSEPPKPPELLRSQSKPLSLSSLSVPEPTIQQYHPSDQRDNSLGGRGRCLSGLPNIYVAPLRASGSEWAFVTCDQPRQLRLSRPTLVLKARHAS